MSNKIKILLGMIAFATELNACALEDANNNWVKCNGLENGNGLIIGYFNTDYFKPAEFTKGFEEAGEGYCASEYKGCFNIPESKTQYACSMCPNAWELMCEAGGVCADVKNNPNHCGQCNNTCKDGTICSEGKCVPDNEEPVTCAPNKIWNPENNTCDCAITNETCQSENKILNVEQCLCVSSSDPLCLNNQHIYNNACEDDSVQNCGSHDNDCATTVTGWKSGTCTKGQCVVSECLDGISVDNNTCKYKAGDYFTFGHYEQDNDTTNGKEAISWRVLDIKDGKYLVISEKALDAKPYNTTWTSITWEKSTIRSWLNGYDASYNTDKIDYSSDNFIDTAFTADEKAKIVASNVPADTNPSYPEIDPGNATTDKIFLLSIVEAQNYFSSDTDRQAEATRYVIAKGAGVYGSESDKYTDDGTCTDVHCYSSCWLRSPGNYYINAADVFRSGSIDYSGYGVDDARVAVRPALLVNL